MLQLILSNTYRAGVGYKNTRVVSISVYLPNSKIKWNLSFTTIIMIVFTFLSFIFFLTLPVTTCLIVMFDASNNLSYNTQKRLFHKQKSTKLNFVSLFVLFVLIWFGLFPCFFVVVVVAVVVVVVVVFLQFPTIFVCLLFWKASDDGGHDVSDNFEFPCNSLKI